MRVFGAVLLSFVLLLMAGCGGSSTATPPAVTTPVTITTTSSTASVVAGASQTFTVTVSGTSNTAVTWSIQEGSAGGTIDASGKYTAPTAAGTYHVIATSMADPTKSVMITVTVTAAPQPVSISISPASANVFTGGSQQFSATVTNTSNTAVNWSVQEGSAGGTIDATGKYTAPSTAGTYHVVATSAADSTKSATAVVGVTSAGPGAFTAATPTGSWNFSGVGPVVEEAVVQLGDGSVLSAGGFRGGGPYTPWDQAGYFYLDAQGNLLDVQVGSLNQARAAAAATRMQDGRVLIAGGYGQSACLTTAEIYDPSTKSFTLTGSMSVARVYGRAVTLQDGTVLVFGSDIGCSPTSTSSAQVYNPKTGTFGATISITPYRNLPATALLPDGRVLLAGGASQDSPEVVTSTAILFDPKTQAFTPTGSLATARAGASATILGDGTVLVAGGWDGSQNLNSAEIYDPKSGTFSPTGTMLIATASRMGTLLLPSGRVLLMCGTSQTTQLYDPLTRSFSNGPAITVPLVGRNVFLMPNGTAMVVAGPTDTFEIYHP